MSAWQHPTDSCPACGQDILLRPEITPDVRMVYVRYCPRCDAGEPVVAPREHASSSRIAAPDGFLGRSTPATAMTADQTYERRRNGIELWWNGDDAPSANSDGDGDGDGAKDTHTRIDDRWAAFAARDADDDDMPEPAEGSFSFGAEDIGRRRRLRFTRPRLRQTA